MKWSQIPSLLKHAALDWREDKAPQHSAALAYYTLFSIAPLLIIAIRVTGLFIGENYARGEIVSEVERYVGKSGAVAIESMITSARTGGEGTIASLISLGVLLFGATGAFAQLQDALNTIWEVPPRKGGGVRGLIRGRLLAFLMVIGIGILLLLSAVVSTVLSVVTQYAMQHAPGSTFWVYAADFIGTALISFLLFALIFKLLPDVEVAWNDVWIGAAITAVLYGVGKIGLGLYLGRGTVASTYGLAGSVMVVLLWTYYSAMILLFGAELTQAYANHYGTRLGEGGSGRRKGSAFYRTPTPRESHGTERWKLMDKRPSETEYLQNEAALARTALLSTLRDLRRTTQKAVDPSVWTRQYPWVAVGIAAAAGLVVGKTSLQLPDPPAQRRRRGGAAERRRLRALERHLAKLSEPDQQALGKLMGSVKRVILRMVKMAIRSSLIAAVSAKTAATAVENQEESESYAQPDTA